MKPTKDIPFKENNKWMHQIGGAVSTHNIINLTGGGDFVNMVSFPDTEQGRVDAKAYFLRECDRLGSTPEDAEFHFDEGYFKDDGGTFQLFYASSETIMKGKPTLRK